MKERNREKQEGIFLEWKEQIGKLKESMKDRRSKEKVNEMERRKVKEKKKNQVNN